MANKTGDSGDPTPYTQDDERELRERLDYAEQHGGTSGKVSVTGRIEWSGAVDRTKPNRKVRLDNLKLGAVKAALADARAAAAKAASTGRLSSYQAKGWEAQLAQLTKLGAAGSAAADAAGLNPTARTLKAWLSGDREPSAANRAKISEAYERSATRYRDAASAASQAADARVAQAFTDAIGDRYGAEVRITDITGMTWD